MKITKEQLRKMISEEISLIEDSWDNEQQLNEEEGGDMSQKYVDYIVQVMTAAKDALDMIENGAAPYDAATKSRFNTLMYGYTDEEFHHHFHG